MVKDSLLVNTVYDTRELKYVWNNFLEDGEELVEHIGKNNICVNPLPHGHISSSRSGIRLLPQVEGQILRPNAPWRFLDRTSYKPSSSRYEIALYGLQF